jgi:hypothetical protein
MDLAATERPLMRICMNYSGAITTGVVPSRQACYGARERQQPFTFEGIYRSGVGANGQRQCLAFSCAWSIEAAERGPDPVQMSSRRVLPGSWGDGDLRHGNSVWARQPFLPRPAQPYLQRVARRWVHHVAEKPAPEGGGIFVLRPSGSDASAGAVHAAGS